MSILFKWRNPNAGETTVNIYRSTSEIDRNALPEKLATVPSGTNQYRDDTAENDVLYYYVLETVVGTKKFTTPNIIRRNVNSTGPGDNKVTYGDARLGFMGQLAQPEICITNAANHTAFNRKFTFVNQSELWYKFMRKGKVIFIPSQKVILNSLNIKEAWTSDRLDILKGIIRLVDIGGTDEENKAYRKKMCTKYGLDADTTNVDDLVVTSGGFKYKLRFPRIMESASDITTNDSAEGVAVDVTKLNGEYYEFIANSSSEGHTSNIEDFRKYMTRYKDTDMRPFIYNADKIIVSAKTSDGTIAVGVSNGNKVFTNETTAKVMVVFELLEG